MQNTSSFHFCGEQQKWKEVLCGRRLLTASMRPRQSEASVASRGQGEYWGELDLVRENDWALYHQSEMETAAAQETVLGHTPA